MDLFNYGEELDQLASDHQNEMVCLLHYRILESRSAGDVKAEQELKLISHEVHNLRHSMMSRDPEAFIKAILPYFVRVWLLPVKGAPTSYLMVDSPRSRAIEPVIIQDAREKLPERLRMKLPVDIVIGYIGYAGSRQEPRWSVFYKHGNSWFHRCATYKSVKDKWMIEKPVKWYGGKDSVRVYNDVGWTTEGYAEAQRERLIDLCIPATPMAGFKFYGRDEAKRILSSQKCNEQVAV